MLELPKKNPLTTTQKYKLIQKLVMTNQPRPKAKTIFLLSFILSALTVCSSL